MPVRLRIPATVTLPSAPLVAGWHLREALGASKQVLHLWRRDRGFPPYHRSGRDYYTDTDAVQRWLEAQNVRVNRV